MPANNSSSTASLSRTVLAGIACGLLTFLVDVPRLDPTFGIGIQLWLALPLICLIRYGIPSAVISFLVALPLIWFFSTAGLSYWNVIASTVLLMVVVMTVYITKKNSILTGLFLAWLLLIPATVSYHSELFIRDLNAGFLVLVAMMISQLTPALLAQVLALRPAIMSRLWPQNFSLPQRKALSLRRLTQEFFYVLVVFPILVTALFFTTESVFLRGQLVESDAQRFASEVIEAALEAKSAALVLDSPAAAEYASQIVIEEVRSITRPRAKRVPFELHLEFVSLSAASALSNGFVYPDAFDPKTPLDHLYERQFREVRRLPEKSAALVVHVALEESVDTGLDESIWGLSVALLLFLLVEIGYRKWIATAGNRTNAFIVELTQWEPHFRQTPHLPVPKDVIIEFDEADKALTQLLTHMREIHEQVADISEERKRLFNQQRAIVTAVKEPMVVIDQQMRVNAAMSSQMGASLRLAFTPILDAARQQVFAGESIDMREDLPDAERLFAHSIVEAWAHGRPHFDINFTSSNDGDDQVRYLASIGVIAGSIDSKRDHGGLVILFTDISLLLNAQNAAAESARMASLGEVATGAAHQLNQPLNIIRMATANLKRSKAWQVDSSFSPMEKLDRIDAQVERASQIIAGMKALARNHQEEWAPLNIASAVEATLLKMAPQFKSAGATVNYESDAQALCVNAHHAAIETLLHSIIGNSLDAFTERDTPNPEVWVRESLVDCDYQLEIIDNAGGIDAKYLDRVFEPFYTTKVKAARSGLGLAIAWRLVDSIGGEIHGENVDGGTCLRIQLPLVAALGTSESPREE